MKIKRHYPIGAEYSKKGVHFRVWAPLHKHVDLILQEHKKEIPLIKEKEGYFSVFVPHLKQGSLYQFGLGPASKKRQNHPDPASRYQPFGVEGPSAVVDSAFPWSDDKWPGIKIDGQIIYELHIGTFTQEGTFIAAAEKLEELVDLGITLIEIMPVNEFPGDFGWGYDGINLFSPYHHYGTSYELKTFIDKAHYLGLGVILDVVYNHFGPDGNFLTKYSSNYFNPEKTTEWGDALNFDHPAIREFFLSNARYWIEEFHFDGLRVDATPWFFCKKTPHILSELTKIVRKARPKKNKVLIGENETQDITLLKTYQEGGYQFDAVWNDDFHHSALVRLKGKNEAYYSDYLGSPQEFISLLKYGYLYQGQFSFWQQKKRGTFGLAFPYSSKVIFIENHDQIANSGRGMRLHQLSDPGNYRALTCLFLLSPNIPLLFQGQEFGASSPFYFFADHKKDLNREILIGRKKFLSQFSNLSTKEAHARLKNPSDALIFEECKLDFKEKKKNKEFYLLHKDLIKLRKEDPVFKGMKQCHVDGAILNYDSFLIRFCGRNLGERLLIVNFGTTFTFYPAPEPLLVAGNDMDWEILWSSDSFAYGGEGIMPLTNPHWKIPGHSATLFKTMVRK